MIDKIELAIANRDSGRSVPDTCKVLLTFLL